jgi:serine/threonine protein kinase
MPGNVPIFKIADFGISCASPETVNQTVIGRGTAIYRAPEVWKHTYGRQADIWGVGCIVLFLAIGQAKLELWWRVVSRNLQRLSEEDWEDENPDPPKVP